MRAERGSGIAAFLVILAVLGAWFPSQHIEPLAVFDQKFYLGIAYDLRHEGRFTNGYFFDDAADGERSSAMRFAPLYPTLLAGFAALDPLFAASLDCEAGSHGQNAACPTAAPLPRTVQFGMLAAIYWLIWWMAGAIAGEAVAAWVALAVALLTGGYMLRSVTVMMTEITSTFLVIAGLAAALAAMRPREDARVGGVREAILSGACMALAALTRPAFLYVGLFCAIASLPLRRGRASLAFLAAFAVVLLPWYLRNAIVVGHFGLTHGYDSHTLVQRLAFDRMGWRDYALSYVCWLPDGNGLGNALAGAHACDEFGWDERPDTYYSIGIGSFMQETLAASGGWDHHLGYLVRTYLLPGLPWHLAVSIPFALRGAWIAHWWGVVLAPLALVAGWRAAAARTPGFLVVLLPGMFALAFNATVAVNQPRYNLMLIAPYAIAGGLFAALAWRRTTPAVEVSSGGHAVRPSWRAPSPLPGPGARAPRTVRDSAARRRRGRGVG